MSNSCKRGKRRRRREVLEEMHRNCMQRSQREWKMKMKNT
jgi:hypothetical protein